MRFFLAFLAFTAGAILATPPAEKVVGRQFFWKAQSKAVPGTLYLLGSLHVGRADFPSPGKPVEAAYRLADRLVFEIDLGEAEKPENALQMMKLGMRAPGTRLIDELSTEVQQRLLGEAAKVGLGPFSYNMWKPWFCAQMLTTMKLLQKGYDPKFGFDQSFYRRAVRDRKTVVPLETVDEQMRLLDKTFSDLGSQALIDTLDELENFDELLGKLSAFWLAGDAEGLAGFLEESFNLEYQARDALLLDRNRKWVPKLEKLASAPGNTFVIVGAGHLVGEESVVELLRKKGWAVERVQKKQGK